jgi:2-(1,2-epoxy-1,2-dihydrophenyl)acetyl-CoA isomerase
MGLPRQMGLARAMGAALFADKISAEQAADWGMIWEAVADERFDEVWRSRAAHLAQGPTEAYKRVKQALQASSGNSLQEQLCWKASCRASAVAPATSRKA